MDLVVTNIQYKPIRECVALNTQYEASYLVCYETSSLSVKKPQQTKKVVISREH
jgi:hypothetical protein